MSPDALVFDLDGTLWETSDVCAAGWNRAVAALGIRAREVTPDDLRAVAGLSHLDAVRRVFPELPEPEIERISELSQVEDNRALAVSGGTLFAGVSELVPALARDLRLFVVSNCQSGYIEVFFATSGLGAHFTDFECWGNTGHSKAENLAAVIARNGLRAPWFVGDTESDRSAARANGVYFVHAAYGFGRVLDQDARIERFDELARLLSP